MAEVRYCNHRETGAIWRCELPKGHSGHHQATTPTDEIHWPNRRGTEGGRRNGQQTAHAELDEVFTDGIKALAISLELRTYGVVRCRLCRKQLCAVVESFNLKPACLEEVDQEYRAALAEAMVNSAKHHRALRNSHGYRPAKHGNDFGHSDPILLEVPICHACHTGIESEIHPGPQLSRSTDGGAGS